MKKQIRSLIPIFILLLFLLGLFLFLNWQNPLLLWDENVYLGNARSHIGESNFTEDFRFPLLEWMIALVWLPGESLLVAKIFMILLSLATVFFSYLIFKEYFSVKKAFLTALCFGLSSLIILWGFKIYADVPALFFMVVSFYCLLKKEKLKLGAGRKGSVFIAIAGVMAALAFLTRFPLALFALCVGIYYLFKKDYKTVLIFSIFFVLALVPWLAYNQAHYQDPLWDIKEQFTVVQEWTSWQPVMKQVKNLFKCMGILAFLLPFGFYSMLRNQNKSKKKLVWLVLGYVVISLVYYLAFVKLKEMRYYLTFLPFLYIISFDGFFWLSSKFKKFKGEQKYKIFSKALYIIILLNCIFIFCFLVAHLSDPGYCYKEKAIQNSIEYLRENVGQEDIIASNFWPFFGYHLNVKVSGLWETNISKLIETKSPTYVVYNNRYGEPYNQTFLDNSTHLKIDKKFEDVCWDVTIYKVIE